MKPKIKKIQYKKKFVYTIVFDNNKKADVDFSSFLWGEAFEPLKNEAVFRQAFVDQTAGTITWLNGVDIAPETLYQKIIGI